MADDPGAGFGELPHRALCERTADYFAKLWAMQNTGLLRRIAAMLYDALLVGALLFLVTVPFIAMRGGEPVEVGDNLVYRAVLVAVIYGFYVGFWTRPGRTLGMQSWGLQLEDRDGGRPTVARATLRFFAALLSWAPAGLGFLWQLWDPEKLAWHDRISGTRLVYYPKEKSRRDAGR